MTMQGQIDEKKFFNQGDPAAVAQMNALVRQTEAIKKQMSPPGTLGLPWLLDKRRCEFGVVDEAFRHQPLFDRILVWQISLDEASGNLSKETWGDTKIIMPETVLEAEKKGSPMGIIVAAGLVAYDELLSHGCQLGDIVSFVRLAPWRINVSVTGAKEQSLMVLRSGDLIGNVDLARRLKDRELRLISKPITRPDGAELITHVYVNEKGESLGQPQVGVIPEDY